MFQNINKKGYADKILYIGGKNFSTSEFVIIYSLIINQNSGDPSHSPTGNYHENFYYSDKETESVYLKLYFALKYRSCFWNS